MINVLFVSHTAQVSGAEKVLLNLLSYFDTNTVKPIVVCPENGTLVEDLRNQNVAVKLVRMPGLVRTCNPAKLLKYCLAFYRYARRFIREIRAAKADIVHCNSFASTLYSILPAKLTKTPVIWHMHDILQDRLFNKMFIRLAALGADKIICVSDATKNGLVKFGVRADKCNIIYNSIRNSEVRHNSLANFRQEIGATGNSKIISMIGQIAKWKGQDVFIEAVDRLSKKHSNIRYVIVGDIISRSAQAYKNLLHNMVSARGLFDLVIFTGFRNDVSTIIANSDIIVHASVRPDPLPTIIIEAMHLGKPVVATNVGGVPELVTNHRTGLIVPPNDPIALANAIAKLIAAPEKASEMGALAREVIQKRFDWITNLRKILCLYDTLLLPNKTSTSKHIVNT